MLIDKLLNKEVSKVPRVPEVITFSLSNFRPVRMVQPGGHF